MKRRHPVNLEASVRQRLKDLADSSGRPFAELLQWYAIERFIARLAVSKHSQTFVLKGAALLRVWSAQPARPTMDIDLGAPRVIAEDEMSRIVRECLETEVEPDGLVFDPNSLEAQPIRIAHQYPGVRVRFRGVLGVARVVMQVDVGFSDSVVPPAAVIEYPSLLGSESPKLLGYRPETVIAEKLEAMVNLGMRTSRMKDYFDVWWLITEKHFEGPTLTESISMTFARRGTEILEFPPVALSERAVSSREKAAQWSAFLRRSRLRETGPAFADVVGIVRDFAEPLFQAVTERSTFLATWSPGGPWQNGGP